MTPVKDSKERVEVELTKDTGKATIYLGGEPILTIEVVCALGDWASGSEGIVAALEGLIIRLREGAHAHGIKIRSLGFASLVKS